MMLLWSIAGLPLGVYNITQSFNIALLVQPQILTLLSLITWAQCKFYRDGSTSPNRWSLATCCVTVTGLAGLMGGIEVALVFGLRHALEQKMTWPAKLMAILAAVLLCAGVARHYVDIYTERTVRGISFTFVAIDALGDLTSLVSVSFQPELDVLGLVIYGSELVLWLGVMACGVAFNLRPWLASRSTARPGAPGTVLRDEDTQPQAQNNDHPADSNAPVQRPASLSSDRSASSISSRSVFRTASSLTRRRHESMHSSSAQDLRLRQLVTPV